MRILIVEDEFFVAMMLEDDLRDAGFVPVGPMRSLRQALESSRSQVFDLAILDINLDGQMVYPLADELAGRGIPFMFVSGYADLALPERFTNSPRLSKPYQRQRLIEEIRRLMARPD